ncbi:DUF996 domain-containing protein [Hydrogenobaculum acidophilum]
MSGEQLSASTEKSKVNISSAKTLGGIGAILEFFLPFIGWILVLISISQISGAVKNSKIIKSYIMGIVFAILGFIISFFFFVPSLLALFNDNSAGFGLGGILFSAIIAYVFWIIASVYIRKSYDMLADVTKENMFKTAGTLFFIGAITTFVFIGYILIFISDIFLIVAFFSAPNEVEISS